MPTNNIRISQLNIIPSVTTSDDFIPLVDSGSLTTYRVSVSNFGGWFSESGSVRSASWASASTVSGTATASISSSWASSSISSSATLHLIYPNSSTASFGQTSLSSSWAISSSNAIISFAATSASWASASISSSYSKTSSYSETASYFNAAATDLSSASWASSSVSSSYANTASYAITASYISGIGGVGDPYPYILQMAFTATYWDQLNFDPVYEGFFSRDYFDDYGPYRKALYNPYPVLIAYPHIFEWDPRLSFYTASWKSPRENGWWASTTYTPRQVLNLWVSYQNGPGLMWYFAGKFYLSIMTDAHTKVTQTYDTNTSVNYMQTYINFNAVYASRGENAILFAASLLSGVKNPLWPTFTSVTTTV